MYEQQLSRNDERRRSYGTTCREGLTAEQELAKFITFAMSFLGSEPTKLLTDIWLDELASMDRTPGHISPDWHMVTVAAIARLSGQLLSLGFCKYSSEV